MKYEQNYNPSYIYLSLLTLLIERILVLTWLFSWYSDYINCLVSNLEVNQYVSWVETLRLLWHMGRVFWFGVSLGALVGLMIGTWEGYLVVCSLVLTLVSPL